MVDICSCCLTKNPAQSITLVRYVDLLKKCFHMKFYQPIEESLVCQKCAHLLKKLEQFHTKLSVAQTFFKRLKKDKTKCEGIITGLSETTIKTDDEIGTPEAAAAIEEVPILSTEDVTVKSEFAESLSTGTVVPACPGQDEGERFNEVKYENLQVEARTANNGTAMFHSAPHQKLKHARKHTKNRLPYKLDSKDRTCPLCRKHFTFFRELSDHMHSHYPNYICHACGKLCATKQSLRSHAATHQSARHKCMHCGKEYNKSSTLKEHDRTAHKGEKKQYKCKECAQVFLTSHKRLMHRIEEHGYEEKRFKCSECSKRYNHGSHLRAHVRSEHRKEKKAHCEQCGCAFFSRSALKKHMVSHSEERNYRCVHCSKMYLRKSSLKQHLKIHENRKDFVCRVCERAFTQKVTLKKHMATHNSVRSKENKSNETMNALSSMLRKL